MLRWSAATACLAVLLAGCTPHQQTPAPTSPPATRLSTVPRATDTPTPAAFRYLAQDMQLALPSTFAGHKLEKSLYVYPGEPDTPPHRRDPLAAHPQVSPELCRDVIQTMGIPGDPGDFIAPTTPSARAFTPLPATTANSKPFVNVVAVEVSPASASARYIVRSYPLENGHWTERTIQYRTDTYAVLVRLDAHANPEKAFLDFARRTRDGMSAGLKG